MDSKRDDVSAFLLAYVTDDGDKLHALSAHDNPNVRAAAAKNEHISFLDLWKLLTDDDEYVRERAMKNRRIIDFGF